MSHNLSKSSGSRIKHTTRPDTCGHPRYQPCYHPPALLPALLPAPSPASSPATYGQPCYQPNVSKALSDPSMIKCPKNQITFVCFFNIYTIFNNKLRILQSLYNDIVYLHYFNEYEYNRIDNARWQSLIIFHTVIIIFMSLIHRAIFNFSHRKTTSI